MKTLETIATGVLASLMVGAGALDCLSPTDPLHVVAGLCLIFLAFLLLTSHRRES